VASTQYTDRVIAGMQMLYGDGFLSPGGPSEMAVFLEGADLSGCRILDLGCGIGGAAVMLVEAFGAAHVTGVDIADDLIPRAEARARERGLADRTTFLAVTPGPLPFDDGAFDVVFIKDVVSHVADKTAQFRELARVLAPGGRLFCAEFLIGDLKGEKRAIYDAWIESMRLYGLTFEFEPFEAYVSAYAAAGLVDVVLRDHTALSAEAARRELAFAKGPDAGPVREALGAEKFAARLHASTMRQAALESRSFLHVHMYARKPAVGEG
jgi:SAM-dependent methyltransferase